MLEYATTHDDPDAVLSHWQLDGAARANTDDGRAYVRVSQSGGDYTISLYRDAARTQLVALGTRSGDTGDVTLAEQNASGLSGSVHIQHATAFDACVDVFYADDDDVAGLQQGVSGFLVDGEFAGRPGFAEPLARAKRVIDALMNARYPEGWRADSLAPLAEATARYALFFLYDYLSTRPDDPGSHLAAHWRREARAVLPSIRISLAGEVVRPFTSRIQRS